MNANTRMVAMLGQFLLMAMIGCMAADGDEVAESEMNLDTPDAEVEPAPDPEPTPDPEPAPDPDPDPEPVPPPAPLNCDPKEVPFTANMTLMSPMHHVGGNKHVEKGYGGDADKDAFCDQTYCGSYFRHGRTSAVKWNAYCAPNAAKTACYAKVKMVNPFLVYGNNTGGSGSHVTGHNPFWGTYSCAFVDDGQVKIAHDCTVNGSEDIKLSPAMTQWGDGVLYGSGYVANHNNDNVPNVGVMVGLAGGGAFTTFTDSTSAGYRKSLGWSQGMACNAQGKPFKLPQDDQNPPNTYPRLGGGEGNE